MPLLIGLPLRMALNSSTVLDVVHAGLVPFVLPNVGAAGDFVLEDPGVSLGAEDIVLDVGGAILHLPRVGEALDAAGPLVADGMVIVDVPPLFFGPLLAAPHAEEGDRRDVEVEAHRL